MGPDFDSDYVLVQLDDGDSRDVHIDQVRYLPEDYPHVGRCYFINHQHHIYFCKKYKKFCLLGNIELGII